MTATSTINHYRDKYWNDLPAIFRYQCRLSTGDPSLFWMDYFKTCYATPPRKRALVFGCGNGWVDRDLCDRNIAEYVDAFDGAAHYLEAAEKLRENRPITYERFDFTTWVPKRRYDLVVNVAALHHVRHLFRMCYLLSKALEPSGLFVHWEYIGPNRNQYAPRHLAVMHGINASLPPRFRTKHRLLHDLHEFVAGDPTEAVHSSDIKRALDDFFEPIEQRVLGGGVAYQLLWNNTQEFEKDDEEARATLDWLIRLDESLTTSGVVPPLFAFMIYGHRSNPPPIRATFNRLVREALREKFADISGGVYPNELLRVNRWTKHHYYGDEPM